MTRSFVELYYNAPEFQAATLRLGCTFFMYRKPKDSKNWQWFGPATVIGREGGNYWASFAGRCHLIAPEHIRIASGEELGAAFTMRATSEDLEKLLEQPFVEEEVFAGDDHDRSRSRPGNFLPEMNP